MKKILLATIIAFGFCQSLSAVLPPLYQGITEIKAILADEALSRALSSGEILEEIKKVEHGYVIITSKQQLRVDVQYKRSNVIGPAQFDLHFHEPEPAFKG